MSTVYVCMDTAGVKVRTGIELDTPMVRKLKYGDLVHGTLTCQNSRGDLRVQLDDGSWTSVYANSGSTTTPFLREATCVDSTYICVSQNEVNVRCGFSLDSLVVKKLRCGEAVRGVLTCRNARRLLRVQLDDGNWTTVHDALEDEVLLQAALPVNRDYICVDTKEVNVRQSFSLDSVIIQKLTHGDLVHGLIECPNSMGHLRVQLDGGGWTSVHGNPATVQFLSPVTDVNQDYVCVDSDGVNVRESFSLESRIVRKLWQGDVAHGQRTCLNAQGELRVQLDDGNWTSVFSSPTSEPFLRKASLADAWYVCVDNSEVNVREGFSLDSLIVRKLRYGDVVRGVLTCTNTHGQLRLRLDQGGWTSVHGGSWSRAFLQAAIPVDRKYVCIDTKAVNVRQGFSLDSPIVCKLTNGDVVHGVLTCRNPEDNLRLRLADGNWTSIRSADCTFLSPVYEPEPKMSSDPEEEQCKICMERPNNIAFTCGHQSCESCAARMAACPFCRITIKKRTKILP